MIAVCNESSEAALSNLSKPIAVHNTLLRALLRQVTLLLAVEILSDCLLSGFGGGGWGEKEKEKHLVEFHFLKFLLSV